MYVGGGELRITETCRPPLHGDPDCRISSESVVTFGGKWHLRAVVRPASCSVCWLHVLYLVAVNSGQRFQENPLTPQKKGFEFSLELGLAKNLECSSRVGASCVQPVEDATGFSILLSRADESSRDRKDAWNLETHQLASLV